MLFRACVAEFFATFMLCLVGGGAIMTDAHLGGQVGLTGIALAHGLALAVGVTATMNVSGGHVNPAVTIAMLLVGRCGLARAIAYIVAQCGGGLLAGILLSFFVFNNVPAGSQDVISKTWNGSPHYAITLGQSDSVVLSTSQPQQRAELASRAAGKAILIEALMTMLLLFAVFGTAVDPRHPNVGGFGVGLTLTGAILLAGPLTGAALNPARALGTGVWWPEFIPQMWVYWVGPVVGAVVAAFIYQHVILDKPAKA